MEKQTPGFKDGVVARFDPNYKVTSLPETSGVNPSLLNAPIYVLNSKSAKSLDCIEVHWEKEENGESVHKTFRFLRSAIEPFPTVTHAKYLDILLSMFAQAPNPEGVLHFRYCDVLAIAGKSVVSRAREAIQQTILRYHRHVTEWENCWSDRSDRFSFTIIRASSILDESGNIIFKSPRKSKKKEDWHTVVFDPEIVRALTEENKRFLLTNLYKKLSYNAYCVYRHYYGYPDFYIDEKGKKKPTKIWRSIEQLRDIFKWTGQKNRFLPWFKIQLEELLKLNLIDKPKWNETNTAVCIHCKNLADIEDKQKVTLVSDSDPYAPEKLKRVGATRNISSLSNEAIIEEYLARKAANRVPKVNSDPIDMMLANPAMVEAGVDLIKRFCLD